MYQGAKKAQEIYSADVYIPAIGRCLAKPKGVVWVLRHHYICDGCSAHYGFMEQAEEPFYCGKCQVLVSITPSEGGAIL